ncbi:DUF1638 domain-containing protein [Sneathiella aquimaris]|uniref:DUF1638 domain-containing protein n=1 Tax=Sneathiella aquimaris TaxID=2599305 RepID=UPI00146B903D|nr:DUF1638 domain-containing protein [Sneathiella aquimaris]
MTTKGNGFATPPTLLIACGALAAEAKQVLEQDGLRHIKLTCLPAHLHNTPHKIPALLRRKIRANQAEYSKILVLYGDCGTAGGIDEVLEEEGAERIAGAHCYEFYAGSETFEKMSDTEPGTFYLTDFLVRHFDRLIWKGLGMDRHPELRPLYFGNYKNLVYLAQNPTPVLVEQAKEAAARLELEFVNHRTGLLGLEMFFDETVIREQVNAD